MGSEREQWPLKEEFALYPNFDGQNKEPKHHEVSTSNHTKCEQDKNTLLWNRKPQLRQKVIYAQGTEIKDLEPFTST